MNTTTTFTFKQEKGILFDIAKERLRQIQKWGDGQVLSSTLLPILMEEVGEVAKAMNENESPECLYRELIQVAAVAVKWAKSLHTARPRESFVYDFSDLEMHALVGF